MCNLSQGAIEKGIQKGIQQGIGLGRDKTLIDTARSVMQNMHMTVDEALNVMNVPQEDRDRIKKALAN